MCMCMRMCGTVGGEAAKLVDAAAHARGTGCKAARGLMPRSRQHG